jgi:hypothetical protein
MATTSKLGFSITTPVAAPAAAPKEDRITPYFLRVTGNNITPDRPVYILGTLHEWPVENYPNSVIQTLKSCALLLSEYPIKLLGDEIKNIKQINAQAHLEIQQRFETMDEPWFRAQMTFIGYDTKKQDQCIRELKEKRAINLNRWQILLPRLAQRNIQAHLDDYGVKLQKLHPLIVETLLDNKITIRNYGSGIEKSLLEYFQEQMRPVVELDDEQYFMSILVDAFLIFMGNFDPIDTIETMQHYCEELDTGIYSDEEHEYADLNEAYAKKELRLNLAKFKMEEEESPSLRARNRSWHPKLLDALGQNRSTAIVHGSAHLKDTTGTIQFLESQGYTVDLAY